MTAFTTGLALIPLALKGNEAGNEIQSPMAIVILGGLLSATLLNLFVIPCVYSFRKK
uniref:efflux RND transporter permease subunit n=1 Tax=uncultured Tenacibaculum sp. TaxID=174713 RepID=UPI00260D1C1E|nr:efflux RND transporter permease subunit [uncultured Tenacibaculum sp.]